MMSNQDTKYSDWPPQIYQKNKIKNNKNVQQSWRNKLINAIKTNWCFRGFRSININSLCWPWVSRLERGLSCISLAGCIGNVYRLPLATMLHGGAPFLIAYLILLALVGFPLVFLEIGIGQIVQQGLTKTWRAVPMFKGVGYIKLIANCIVCIYYPLYIGLALYYMIWLLKGPLPFTECSYVKISRDGYVARAIPGQQCLNKTFLESPLTNPKWYGIYVGLVALVWLVIMFCSFRKIKTYMRWTNCFFIPIVACLIALLVKSIDHQIETDTAFKSFYENIDWEVLFRADVWYFAIIQLFFSTHLGFGNVITCAGKIYNKTDPFWGAVAYFVTNVAIGVLATMVSYILCGLNFSLPQIGEVTELQLFASIYKNAADNSGKLHIWAGLAFLTIFLSGIISMLVTIFTILKAIHVETKKKWLWRNMAVTFCVVFFILSCACLFIDKFQLVHVFDHYTVGNLLLLATFLEVGAFVVFYGASSIYIDFEFILGNKLNVIWKFLWGLAPILIAGFAIWGFCTLPLTGLFYEDQFWMYITGWSLVGVCIFIVVFAAIYEVYIQVDYNFMQKLSSALKASRKWGPVDPMLRHGWIQWRSKSGEGDRDFTLRRRGTKEYTRSVKHRKRQQNANSNLTGTQYMSTANVSDATTTQRPSSGSEMQYDTNINVMECEYVTIKPHHPLQVVSITDTLERRVTQKVVQSKFELDSSKYETRAVLNPLGHIPSMYGDYGESNSEGYGTIRNGPFIISKDDFDHVCWRRAAENVS